MNGASAQISRRWIPAHVPLILAWLGLILALLHLFWSLGSTSPAVLEGSKWISSDSLYPVNVATDILRDGYPLSGWRFSVAPHWFPDLFTTGLFWVITRNAITATLLAGFIQLALIVGAFQLIRKAISLGSGSLPMIVLLAVAVGLTLYVAAHPELAYPDFYRFFIPQSHVGGLIMSLYALALGLMLLDRAHRDAGISCGVATTYAGVCLLAGMSNLMFFPQMLAGFTAAIAAAIFFHVLPASKCWLPAALGWSSAVAGAILNRMLFHVTNVSAQSHMSLQAALTGLDVFVRGALEHLLEPLHILAVLWFVMCLAIAAVTLRKLAHQQEQAPLPQRLLWVFCCCWVFSDLFSAGAMILGGSDTLTRFKDYIWTTHYLQSIFFIPLFGIPLTTVWLLPQRTPSIITRGIVWCGSLLLIAVPAIRLATSPVPKSGISSYRPQLVQFLDDLASKEGVRYGLAPYWEARITTLLSKTGLRVYAVDGSLQPFLWVNNIKWYTEAVDDRHERPPFRFVVLDDPNPAFIISRETVVQMFGQPSKELRFQNTRVLVYPGNVAWTFEQGRSVSRSLHR